MTLQQLDEALKLWERELAAVAGDLLSLQADPVYQSLAGLGGANKQVVTGASARLAETVLTMLPALFEHFGRLQARVGEAETIRRGLPSIFGAEARLRAAERALAERSLEASELVARGVAPLAGTAGVAVGMTPGELLLCLRGGVQSVAKFLLEMREAQARFDETCLAIKAEIATMRGEALLPGVSMEPLLGAVEERMAGVQASAGADLVGAMALLSREVRPLLERAAGLLAKARALYAQLAAADVRWGELKRVHREACALEEHAGSRVVRSGAGPQPVAATRVSALGEWLARLRGKADEGALEAVAVGVRHWMLAAEEVLAHDRGVLAACQGQMELRSELRGRLRALQAKAEAVQGQLSGQAAALSGRAEALLYTAPVELREAAQAVAALEHSLQQPGASSRPSPGSR